MLTLSLSIMSLMLDEESMISNWNKEIYMDTNTDTDRDIDRDRDRDICVLINTLSAYILMCLSFMSIY